MELSRPPHAMNFDTSAPADCSQLIRLTNPQRCATLAGQLIYYPHTTRCAYRCKHPLYVYLGQIAKQHPFRMLSDLLRGKSRPSGRGRIAQTPRASCRELMRRSLLLDVLADDFDGCASTASGKVGRRP